MELNLRTSPLRAKIIAVPPTAILGIEISISEALAGWRKRLLNFTVICTVSLFNKR